MGALIDLTGQRFGKWTVLSEGHGRSHGQAAWRCRCECGVERLVSSASLRGGVSTSCGCARPPSPRVIDLRGLRFGRLTVVSRAPNDARGGGMWLVRCDCDTDGTRTYAVHSSNLRNNRVRSCGCLHTEGMTERTTHGLTRARTKHPLYNIWCGIRGRCTSPKNPAFALYGAKGITVCARWNKDFAAFVADMGDRPSPHHSVDRIDVKGGYWCGCAECSDCGPLKRSPNCRWATSVEQARNTSRNRMVTIDGVTKCASQWADEKNINRKTLLGRLKRGGANEPASILVAPRSHRAKVVVAIANDATPVSSDFTGPLW